METAMNIVIITFLSNFFLNDNRCVPQFPQNPGQTTTTTWEGARTTTESNESRWRIENQILA